MPEDTSQNALMPIRMLREDGIRNVVLARRSVRHDVPAPAVPTMTSAVCVKAPA